MTQVIKFRAWDKNFGQMLHKGVSDYYKGDELAIRLDGELLYVESGEINKPRNNYILMQYTDLKDQDGKEIYEGDILEFYVGLNEQKEPAQREVGTVEWNPTEARYRAGRWTLDSFWASRSKVIGNIYEDPEITKYSNKYSRV